MVSDGSLLLQCGMNSQVIYADSNRRFVSIILKNRVCASAYSKNTEEIIQMTLDRNRLVEIIGLTAVVLSLLFVAFEIQQANRIALVAANKIN